MYKVKRNDLKGQIEYFPLEVVQKIIEKQVEQGNKADVFVFQRRYDSSDSQGGFDWDKTAEGYDFWFEVILGENFNLFFEKYPKQEDSYKIHFKNGTTLDVSEAELKCINSKGSADRVPILNVGEILYVIKK